MKFTDLECCPFCGYDEYYERQTIVGGHINYGYCFDEKVEADNSDMYDQVMVKYNGRRYCRDCGRYLGDANKNTVGVRAERAYKKQQ